MQTKFSKPPNVAVSSEEKTQMREQVYADMVDLVS